MEVAGLMDRVADAVGSDGLERIEQMLKIRAGEEPMPERPAMQWAGQLHMPGLHAKPWYEPEEFAWSQEVLGRAVAMQSELKEIVAHGTPQDYGNGWNVFFIWRGGTWVAGNADRCPVTREALSATPISPGESCVSMLKPGAQTNIHSGEWNLILTCHFGVDVPKGCELLAGNERRSISERELMIFDDSFAHTAWNPSDRPRSCLVWVVWHPDLTEREVAALEFLLPTLYEEGTKDHVRTYA